MPVCRTRGWEFSNRLEMKSRLGQRDPLTRLERRDLLIFMAQETALGWMFRPVERLGPSRKYVWAQLMAKHVYAQVEAGTK